MKKHSHRVQVNYSFLMILLAVFMLFLGVFIGSHKLSEVEAQAAMPAREKYYTSILIEEGDTLWSIADEYMTYEYSDRDAYMDEVREMNNLTGSFIRSGDLLLVPYYADGE